jgi:hypothetical protein
MLPFFLPHPADAAPAMPGCRRKRLNREVTKSDFTYYRYRLCVKLTLISAGLCLVLEQMFFDRKETTTDECNHAFFEVALLRRVHNDIARLRVLLWFVNIVMIAPTPR